MDYIAYLHKDRDSDFGVSFPDFPGCITAGKTLEEARQMAAEALALHLTGMIEDGSDIPEPSTLDSLAGDPAIKDAIAFLVHLEPQRNPTVRINITARENQVQEIDQLAAAAGMTRSAYMVNSALKKDTLRRADHRIAEGVDQLAHRPGRRVKMIAAQADRTSKRRYGRAMESAHLARRKKKS